MEEDIEIIKKHYVFTTNHVLDDENKRFKQAIENLINRCIVLEKITDDHIKLFKNIANDYELFANKYRARECRECKYHRFLATEEICALHNPSMWEV